MHKWNEITDENSLKEFMERVSFFHDSCIKEMHYLSGAYVNENLDIKPGYVSCKRSQDSESNNTTAV